MQEGRSPRVDDRRTLACGGALRTRGRLVHMGVRGLARGLGPMLRLWQSGRGLLVGERRRGSRLRPMATVKSGLLVRGFERSSPNSWTRVSTCAKCLSSLIRSRLRRSDLAHGCFSYGLRGSGCRSLGSLFGTCALRDTRTRSSSSNSAAGLRLHRPLRMLTIWVESAQAPCAKAASSAGSDSARSASWRDQAGDRSWE